MTELVYRNETTLRAIALALSIIIWLALLVGTVGVVIVYVLLFALFAVVAHSALIAHLRGNAVRISAKQMPDLYQRLYRCAAQLGVQPVPDAYLINGNGLLNAFATRFLGRNFVVLLSDVVDSMDERPGALDFYIGHELGHLKRKHLTWGKILAPALFLPLIGAAYSRAREYTCDRHGLAVCENPEDAQFGLAALAAGKRRWKNVDLQEFSASAAISPGFWMSLHELVGDYPWLNKRQAWLRALPENGKPRLGKRNPFAFFFSMLLPRVPGLGIGGGVIVVAYVAILAAIAVPAYQDYINRTAAMTATTESVPYRTAIASYAISHQQWPTSLDQIGLSAPVADRTVETVELQSNGQLQLNFKVPTLHEHPLLFTPAVERGNITWHCSSDMPAKWLPPSCK